MTFIVPSPIAFFDLARAISHFLLATCIPDEKGREV